LQYWISLRPHLLTAADMGHLHLRRQPPNNPTSANCGQMWPPTRELGFGSPYSSLAAAPRGFGPGFGLKLDTGGASRGGRHEAIPVKFAGAPLPAGF